MNGYFLKVKVERERNMKAFEQNNLQICYDLS